MTLSDYALGDILFWAIVATIYLLRRPLRRTNTHWENLYREMQRAGYPRYEWKETTYYRKPDEAHEEEQAGSDEEGLPRR